MGSNFEWLVPLCC